MTATEENEPNTSARRDAHPEAVAMTAIEQAMTAKAESVTTAVTELAMAATDLATTADDHVGTAESEPEPKPQVEPTKHQGRDRRCDGVDSDQDFGEWSTKAPPGRPAC
jgi:hypothetical protein